MWTVIAGGAVITVTGALFWRCLPRDGKKHRWVGTELEPYIAVAFTAGASLGLTLILSGLIDLFG
jgi:hypothetical protein